MIRSNRNQDDERSYGVPEFAQAALPAVSDISNATKESPSAGDASSATSRAITRSTAPLRQAELPQADIMEAIRYYYKVFFPRKDLGICLAE
ncbi:hypothetical protein LMH87_002338 [Akanthomyces muscarius]|uniref:Uncharacterized protein n=1 Tax=Akanthomyces muscarius TaxID=2231603 RepID=A0A9W8Q8L3_AKAMU|nr:hypothetical protein LMH87_002338 [Akanthomyces muscarius]KAJ4147836.1 hypothetical protein LMH87_002338 [Akanthomyces muscarius]